MERSLLKDQMMQTWWNQTYCQFDVEMWERSRPPHITDISYFYLLQQSNKKPQMSNRKTSASCVHNLVTSSGEVKGCNDTSVYQCMDLYSYNQTTLISKQQIVLLGTCATLKSFFKLKIDCIDTKNECLVSRMLNIPMWMYFSHL